MFSKDKNIFEVETSSCDDAKIVKLAKLILILTDKNTDDSTKAGCLKLAIKQDTISLEEALDLAVSLPTLQNFMEED